MASNDIWIGCSCLSLKNSGIYRLGDGAAAQGSGAPLLLGHRLAHQVASIKCALRG